MMCSFCESRLAEERYHKRCLVVRVGLLRLVTNPVQDSYNCIICCKVFVYALLFMCFILLRLVTNPVEDLQDTTA